MAAQMQQTKAPDTLLHNRDSVLVNLPFLSIPQWKNWKMRPAAKPEHMSIDIQSLHDITSSRQPALTMTVPHLHVCVHATSDFCTVTGFCFDHSPRAVSGHCVSPFITTNTAQNTWDTGVLEIGFQFIQKRESALTVGGVGLEERCKHQGLHSHQLDEDVQGWARCVLEGVSHSVTNDGGLVCVRALASQGARMLCGLGLHSIKAFLSASSSKASNTCLTSAFKASHALHVWQHPSASSTAVCTAPSPRSACRTIGI